MMALYTAVKTDNQTGIELKNEKKKINELQDDNYSMKPFMERERERKENRKTLTRPGCAFCSMLCRGLEAWTPSSKLSMGR